jgi:tetratricopeptide (TPR) repeat protein
LNPNFAEAYYNRGRAYLFREKEGDDERSIKDLDKAIKLNPNFADIYHYGRGKDYLTRYNYINAIENFEKATKDNPKFAEAYYNLGEVYFAAEKYSLASYNFNKAIKIKPDLEIKLNERLKSLYNSGESYFLAGNYSLAIDNFNKIIKLKPNLEIQLNARLKTLVNSLSTDSELNYLQEYSASTATSGYVFGYPSELTNGNFSLLIVVKLFSVETKPPQLIRVVFIRAGATFQIEDLRKGKHNAKFIAIDSRSRLLNNSVDIIINGHQNKIWIHRVSEALINGKP